MLGVGNATRLLHSEFLHDSKVYRVRARLGATTPTLDLTSEISEEKAWQHVTEEHVRTTLNSFHGHQLQKPPLFSALKVNGVRLYELARMNEKVDLTLKSRPIFIFRIQPIEIQLPEIELGKCERNIEMN